MPPAPDRRPALLSSRTAFDGKLLRVRVDTVRLPSGREGVREVVEHGGGVAVLALTAERQVILIRQRRYPIGRALLEIPAGLLDRPGEAPVEAAVRELGEEAGYRPGRIAEVAAFYTSPGFTDERLTLFRADDCVPVEREEMVDEPADLVLVPLADVAGMVAPGPDQIADAKTLIALLWLLNAPEAPAPAAPATPAPAG